MAGSQGNRSKTAANTRVARGSSPAPRAHAGSSASADGDPRRPKKAGAASTIVATVLGFSVAAGAAGAVVWSGGCSAEPPPGASIDVPARTPHLTPPATPAPPPSADPGRAAAAPAPSATASGAPSAAEPEKPYTGPLLGATAQATPVYAAMDSSKARIGYIRHGGKVPVDPTPIKSSSCSQGWYRLLDGGFVCGKYASLDMKNPQVRLGVTPPNLDEVLPYRYAYNTAHGTPLYRSVPSKEEMIKYEPYLEAAKRARRKAKKDAEEEAAKAGAGGATGEPAPAPPATDDTGDPAGAAAAAAAIGILDGGTPSGEDTPPPPPKPWWQQEPEKGQSLNVKLSDLEQDSDTTIAKRMVKGFFVAVDKSFGWNNRLWYKSTSGLVAPADRMYIAKPPTSQGIDVPAGVKQVGFITSAKAAKYEFDEGKTKVSVVGPVPRFTAFGLTGATVSHKTVVYRQTTEGWWMKGIDGTFTEPGAPPADLAPGEKWIDVNLSRKTLMAFEGDMPVYAALVSPGKKSKDKKKDHSTIQGTFRIREKHITTTMDGDGAVAGDLPYSIEDVPYVSYFEGSYALHGAFWHSNFGREMSHGCVNLSPLDAKKIFFWSEPRLPRGWHGVWASAQNRGTLVVIHE